ncbi:maleylpyruvate isomerase family mycothiol-dependent enzyme [Nocardioides marinquilinus]|uniref:Maleylpyruvate isomerase family mycothiol-dependent enzyme n=1 Tax=Nocardioides marinquilinus TaxID=1210400 RepID=A0ABP9PS83_9ACTN
MTPDHVRAATRAERSALADLVETFTPQQWATPSLCEAWTVRHVVAHLTTTTRTGLGGLVAEVVRARGSFDRMEQRLAQRLVDRHDDAALVALLRGSASSDRRVPMSGVMDPLMDVVVHAQDVARPLGLVHETPPEVVAACLAHVAGNRFMGGPARLAGVRLESDDTGLTHGGGATLRGRDVDLLLVAAGRRAGLDALRGPGRAVLGARLPAAASPPGG